MNISAKYHENDDEILGWQQCALPCFSTFCFFFNLRRSYLFCTSVLYQQYFPLVPRVQMLGLSSSKSSGSQCFPAAFLQDSKTKTESKTFAFFSFPFLLFFVKSKPLVPAMINKSSAGAARAARSKMCDLCLGFKLMLYLHSRARIAPDPAPQPGKHCPRSAITHSGDIV